MRKVLTFFIIIILTIIQTKNSISHEINKNQIDEIIREFIINNPNVLEKSILNYKESKAKKKFVC